MAFTPEYIERMKDRTQGDINKMQFELNNEWFDCEILKIGADGDFRRALCDIPTSAEGTITGIRAVDENGNVIHHKSENVTKSAGMAYSFAFEFTFRGTQI